MMIVLFLVMASSGKGAGWLPKVRTSSVEVELAPSASNSIYRVVVHSAAMVRLVLMLSSVHALVSGPSFGSGRRMKSLGFCGLPSGVRVIIVIVVCLGGVMNPAQGLAPVVVVNVGVASGDLSCHEVGVTWE